MKKKNLFMSVTIMCALLTVGFTFRIDQITWFWNETKPVGVILGMLAVIFAILWIKHHQPQSKVTQKH